MLLREEPFSFPGLGLSASRCSWSLFLPATDTGLIQALTRSEAFTLQKEILGEMMVEMKVTHPTFATDLRRHEQGQAHSRAYNPIGNPRASTSPER